MGSLKELIIGLVGAAFVTASLVVVHNRIQPRSYVIVKQDIPGLMDSLSEARPPEDDNMEIEKRYLQSIEDKIKAEAKQKEVRHGDDRVKGFTGNGLESSHHAKIGGGTNSDPGPGETQPYEPAVDAINRWRTL